MNLTIRLKRGATMDGGALVLCDEDGNMLPGQQGCVLETEIEEEGVLTVRFIVDGERVRIATED